MAGTAPKQFYEVYYVGILRNTTPPAVELAGKRDLTSFSRFTRGTYDELMTTFITKLAERTKPGERSNFKENVGTIHTYGSARGVCAVMVAESDYPALNAQAHLSKMIDEFTTRYPESQIRSDSPSSFTYPELDTYIKDFKDIDKTDNIAKVQRELDETKVVLQKTIESVLERGEKIDDLVAKSDGLSTQSRMFYQTAKKQNSCCIVM